MKMIHRKLIPLYIPLSAISSLLILLCLLWDSIPPAVIQILVLICGIASLLLVILWRRRQRRQLSDLANNICETIDALMDGREPENYHPYEDSQLSKVQGKLLQYYDRMQEGKRVSPSVPYGYRRDPDDKQHLIIDPEPAAVVRRIFKLVLEGNGVNRIADILYADKILIPSAYAEKYYPENQHSKSFHDPIRWTNQTIIHILEKREYMGHTVLGKTISESYKTKKRRKATEDELMIFENTHEAIIDEETWNNVQRLIETKRRPKKNGAPPCRLSGLLYCADCGSKLSHRYNSRNKYDADNSYGCSSYRQYTRNCTMHYIRVSVVEKLILETIREVSAYALSNEKEFVKKVREASDVQQEATMKEYRRRLGKAKRRHEELDDLVKKLYESFATGKIPEKHFDRLLSGYDAEQTALEAEMQELQTGLDRYGADSVRADRFLELVKRYTDFSELTTPMLNEFIEKVVVHEADKSTGDRVQKVDIYLNFIGAFTVPKMEAALTAEQEAREQRKLQARNREREQNRLRMQRYRARQKELAAAAN